MPTDIADDLLRYARLESDRRRLLAEAIVALASAWTLVALRPFRQAIQHGAVRLSSNRGSIADCTWAIAAASRRMPMRLVCIHKGLALQRMLRCRGHDARLHYGIGRDDGDGDLQAHVWVTVDGVTLIGGEDAPRFAPVAVYP